MRIRFDHGTAPFSFSFEDKTYELPNLKALAHRCRVATNICEYVYKLPNGYIYLTIVGEEDQNTAFGVTRGWYVVESVTEEHAMLAVEAMNLIHSRGKPKR